MEHVFVSCYDTSVDNLLDGCCMIVVINITKAKPPKFLTHILTLKRVFQSVPPFPPSPGILTLKRVFQSVQKLPNLDVSRGLGSSTSYGFE